MKQDVVNLCIEHGAAIIRDVNDLFTDFVRELGGAAHLPKKFTLNVTKMTKLERDIEQAIVDGDLQKTQDLCDEYKKRFTAYMDGWRKQLVEKGATV